MTNYFRITAYHPEQDTTVILDSNGLFDKLWQFSSDLLQKGFKILEVGNAEKFLDEDIQKVEEISDKYILRAYAKGKPQYTTRMVHGVTYKAVAVNDLCYIPDITTPL